MFLVSLFVPEHNFLLCILPSKIDQLQKATFCLPEVAFSFINAYLTKIAEFEF